MLSYTQTLNAKGNLPKLDVRMTKPGLHIRYGYTGGPATKDAEIQEAVVANHTAAQLANDLRISLANETPVADGESRRVRLHVMIPVKSLKLVQEGTDVTGGFAIYVSMGDGKGNASQVNRQTHEIRWPAEKLPSLIEKSIGFNVDVVLLPGRNQVSVGVMDERSKTMGFAKAAI